MDIPDIDVPAGFKLVPIKLEASTEAIVLVVGTVVGFLADYYSKKGLTSLLLSRKS